MNERDVKPTKQTPAICDNVNNRVDNWRAACANDFYVIQTLRRAEAEIRSAIYDATCDLNISKDVPADYRQMLYDCRAEDRKNPCRDRFRLVMLFHACRHVVPFETASRCLERIDRVEQEIDALVVGPRDPGPEGRKAEPAATMRSLPRAQMHGVVLGSLDITGGWKRSAA
jgi:hypothetical protein